MRKYKVSGSKKSVKSLQLSSKKLLKSLTNNSKTQFKNFQKSSAYHWLDYRNYQGLERTLHSIGLLIMAGLIVFSAISPLVDIYVTHRYYSLNSSTSSLVGSVSDTLAKQITYDSSKDAYVFNASGMTPATQTVGPDKVPLALLQAKVAGNKSKSKSTYSVVMPTDPKAGISYYDSNTGLSFQLVPNFTEMGAKQIDNHIIYPTNNHTQMVYSVKNNGLKEDIVLKQFVGDSLSFSYNLKLPQTLEARLLTDGSGDLGIYSADPSLFSAATTGSEADPAKTESAKLHAKKDHLVFTVPAPVIKQTGQSGQAGATAKFKLSQDGKTLVIGATNLKTLHYPASIDPTVVVTSTSDFSTGNNEDNITYPANQINRGSLTGGSISGGWTATTALPATINWATSVTYNGYVYEIGGNSGPTTATVLTTVYYAPLNSNGTIGSWTATTSLPTATYYASSVAYNGYLYEIGGDNGSAAVTTVLYAPINANGTIGSWTATTSLPTTNNRSSAVVYNGYIYEIGGYDGVANTATVLYAPINANGTIGSWTATTALPTATRFLNSVVYNGYLYEIGGYTSAPVATVAYAPINANGTVGSWIVTTSLTTATSVATSVVYNGYLYEIGGDNPSATSVVSYAPINANGTIGSWTATASLSATTDHASSIAYNGYIYEIGGYNGTSPINTVNYAKIDPAGVTTAYSATTALPSTTNMASSVAYNGYVYEIAGNNPSTSTTVLYAPINSNGTIGAWTATTALPTAAYGATAVAYNGYLYEIGGYNAGYVATVYYAPINANGTVGAWTATTALPTGNFDATSVVYNGYLYVIGGQNGTGEISTVDYAPINANGTVGTWTATTSLPGNRNAATSVVYNGYIYEISGRAAGTYYNTVYYAPINANGSIGSWTATTALPTGLAGATAVVYNGYIYEIGGLDATSHYNNVNYAPINANGTVGSWVATAALPNITAWATSVVYNGYIYEIGGDTGTVSLSNVYYAAINNGGPGTVGAWTATTALPAAKYAATSAVYNGYIYEIGGIITGGTYVTTVFFAPINANGTIGTWAATTSLPVTTGYATSVAYNGYLYEIGGNNGSAAVSTVYYAPINADGTLGSWTATTALPAATYNATSVVYKGYLYEIGGYTTGYTANVYYAPLNSNGTIGAWTATTSLPVATAAATSVVYNGYVYEISGASPTSLYTVLYAPLNSNGTIGAWTATTSLPIPPTQATSVAYNGYLYEFGGVNISSTYYAPINANGTIGAWTAATGLPTVNGYAAAVAYNGYVYQVGGCSGSCAISTVNYAPLNVMPRVGHYSQLFNLGTTMTPVSITYNGNLPNAYGLSSVQYRTAGSNGVFGANQYSSTLAGSATSCTPGFAQYVQATLTLDDSGSAAFPDVNATSANVTDFTLTYATTHSQPNMRLRGGKFFINNALTALDTCALVPTAPTIGTATAGNMSATVTFTDNASGDSPITNHTVTSYPGGLTGTGSSPVTVSGLTNGVSYTFTVTATSASGTSAASAASNSITPGSVVTGGTLTADATYYYRTFTSSGTLGVSGVPLTADILIVGGGGSGGWPYSGGGGGGGVLFSSGVSLSATSHTVTVGAGGVGGYNLGNGQKGGNSSLDSYVAISGGGGVGDSAVTAAQNGGSGGGGADITRNPTGNNGGTGVAGQGFAGGKGSPVSSSQQSGGGGGGAGALGADATATAAGNGGAGTNAYATWATVTGTGDSGYYGGGGGGGTTGSLAGSGGLGGGGRGARNDGTQESGAGLANTGGGSGGGGAGNAPNSPKSGGSGIVIVRYLKTAVAPPVVNGGTLASDSTYYYRTFTSSGTLSVSGGIVSADILTIGGGGGGASGGGGAGGVVYSASQSLTETSYTVTVGAGGTGGTGGGGATLATVGGNSQFGTLTAAVGGGNGARIGDMGVTAGGSGASGGGGGAWSGGTTTGGTGTQGNNGGGNGGFVAPPYPAGGGGGFGGVGGTATGAAVGGTGGAGTNAYSAWATATGTGVGGSYAGGGGGAVYAGGGTGGTASAGGGAGNVNGAGGINGTAGTPNSGGGGGGGQASGSGGNGGSGVVIVRYLKTAVAPPPIVTGGILAADTTYYYRTFLSSGTFSITGGSVTADVLVIAGGGGSGGGGYGSGGGAGGVVYSAGQAISSSKTVTIGSGGVGALNTGASVGANGGNSAFGSIVATGGGGGGSSGAVSQTAGSGGSGGGAGANNGGNGNLPGLASPAGQGFGGGSANNGGTFIAGSGGGGAGAVGGNNVATNNGGAGGAGLNTWSSWASATGTGVGGYYAGGGGGSGYISGTFGPGGSGGGGSGAIYNAPVTIFATNGLANTGGGGGGGSANSGSTTGAGGSGIVIIRYTRAQVGG